nr:extracellular solute-binding protein [Paenibacillus sacheonensis]
MDEAEFQYWVKGNESYQQSHPNVSIELTNIHAKDADEARKEASESGEPFDIMLLDDDRVREFAMLGYLLPVDEIVTGDSAADLLEALTGMVKWNGSLWGVPVDSNPTLNVWSKKLLKAAGDQEPPTTMNAFKSIVSTLTALKPDGFSPFNLNTADARDLSAWLGLFPENAAAAAGLSPFNASQQQQLQFAAEHARQLARFDPLTQRIGLLHAFRSETLLGATIPWSVYFAMTDEERALLTVGSQNSPVVRTNGRSFVLTAETDKLAEAREWIQDMTGSNEQLDRYRIFGRLPARVSVMTGEFVYNEIADRPPHFLARMLQAAAAVPDPPWRERWARWSALCASLGGNGKEFLPETAAGLISAWNEAPPEPAKNDAEAPSSA